MTREEKARWLSEIYAAMAEGKTVQYLFGNNWLDYVGDIGPDMGTNEDIWRIKPEPREATHLVAYFDGCLVCGNWVKVPDSWSEGTKVRVTEILE